MNKSGKSQQTPTRERIGDSALASRLRRELEGEVLFDAFSRGRYSTDASIYQIEPIGVVVPRSEQDIVRAVQIAADEGIPILPRGGGTSQIGQTVGEALVVDTSKYLNQVKRFDAEARSICVEPGMVLDQLNRYLKPHGLFYPVDVSTGNRATLGGMAGNNSCGARSIRYGNMVHNVEAIDAILADSSSAHFSDLKHSTLQGSSAGLAKKMIELGQRESHEIRRRFPALLRRVGGYNINEVMQLDEANLARLLVGSEGTLAFFSGLHLELQPIPPHKLLGICHFPSFHQAMDSAQDIVRLDPAAVELVDRTMIDLSREIPLFRATVDRFVQGEPDALLLVEFAGDEREPQLQKLKQLGELMADLGFPGAVVEALDPDFQAAVWEVRKAGLNIMMSMKGDGKPVSFIEDCAVRLEDLAEYTDRLTRVFEKYGTTGTWYAHASVGCLHVRPILNMKDDSGASKMRAIMEETLAIVEEYKGSHSGEHGDGLARSEFHQRMFGSRILRAFEEVKDSFDPAGLFNPGKIVRAPRMDDRELFRYAPGYRVAPIDTALDWSEWGGFGAAVEMCNNNGACRKANVGVMCPSYRATGDEQHLTRGRANTLRLAVSGQLGADALVSEAMYDSMDLCLGCKGCKRECPTGIDMAKMKIEFLHHYRKRHRLSLRDRLVAYLPRYAPIATRLGFILNLRDRLPGLAWLSERLFGLSARRSLPRWRTDYFDDRRQATDVPTNNTEVVLLVDTFNRYFEPENARAALAVLQAAGYRVRLPQPLNGGHPLCEGRTFLALGLVDEARAEAERLLAALKPYIDRGVPIVGLEPSSLLTLRDEFKSLFPGDDSEALAAQALLLEEFLAQQQQAGKLRLELKPLAQTHAVVHGHCHQKAFATMTAMQQTLALIPGLTVEVIDAGCCGMAGAFGYEADHYQLSMRIGELGLLPAVRAAADDALLIANGTSCRHQIVDGARREAVHIARVLQAALA
ncbi:MAG: FAD-binding protein [Gammaproteobacteria bacterium]|nr:FAD-binding protein [Gammaproteobacteria bacterium]